MGALPYPPTRRPPATRIYHSHSRSRQLLSLPITPIPSNDQRSYKSIYSSTYPNATPSSFSISKLIRLSFLLAAGLVLFFFFEGLHRIPLSYVTVASSSHRLISSSRTIPNPLIHQQKRIPRNVHTNPTSLQHQLQTNSDEQPQISSININSKDHQSKPVQAINLNTIDHIPSIVQLTEKQNQQQPISKPIEKQQLKQIVKTKTKSSSFRDPADFLSFNDNTALNYFHLHKTGGVSFKEKMFDFFILEEKRNRHNKKPNVRDTCHMSGAARPALGIEAEWSCDWQQISKFSEQKRNDIDVIVGHQYWEKGAGFLIPKRDLRYFTVMRHPLHRKISFFYHFFIRNAGRKEDSVTTTELIQFVLGKKMPQSPLIRDAGPGYYASRLWSDGLSGYDDYNKFVIPKVEEDDLVEKSIERLRHNFIFIGLQTQEKASLCMLKTTVEHFAKAHGFHDMKGLDAIAKQKDRMNTGSYALTGEKLWSIMTKQQKEEFKKVEKVDLAIYGESMKMFKEMAKRMKCDHLIDNSNTEDNIAYSI